MRRGGRLDARQAVPHQHRLRAAIGRGVDAEVEREIARWRHQFKFEKKVLGLGIERIDYTKGIPERLRAIDRLLETRPEYRGRLIYAQAGVPSRGHIEGVLEGVRPNFIEGVRPNFKLFRTRPTSFEGVRPNFKLFRTRPTSSRVSDLISRFFSRVSDLEGVRPNFIEGVRPNFKLFRTRPTSSRVSDLISRFFGQGRPPGGQT